MHSTFTRDTKYHSNQVRVFSSPKPESMISSNGCVTHLREMFLKDHSVEVSFLGVWCIVWIHVLCMFQHAICHLHTKFCIPPSCLNFVFKNNWNYDKIFLLFFIRSCSNLCSSSSDQRIKNQSHQFPWW